MAVGLHHISPVAHWPLVLGGIRQRNVAARIATCCPPHPAQVLSGGCGVEALLRAILDGQHALYQVGTRLEERGLVPLLQPGRPATALNDSRLGPILDALFAANRHRVCRAVARTALEVYAMPRSGLAQETTTSTLSGASAEDAQPRAGLLPPRPA